jgi:hypothetical protein
MLLCLIQMRCMKFSCGPPVTDGRTNITAKLSNLIEISGQFNGLLAIGQGFGGASGIKMITPPSREPPCQIGQQLLSLLMRGHFIGLSQIKGFIQPAVA